MTPIEQARNLGPATGCELRAAGISSREALVAIGWQAAWDRLRQVAPSRDNLICGYALAGAEFDVDWRHLPNRIKDEVRSRQWKRRQTGLPA